jgi:hypothetical protein
MFSKARIILYNVSRIFKRTILREMRFRAGVYSLLRYGLTSTFAAVEIGDMLSFRKL